ncbi:MAG TPA: RNA ligase family protein, partial [Candidatus Methylacidiphilales bacterium]|nr:RNA ligase family protein [Candidatus Methylacidiphilales bacterium]
PRTMHLPWSPNLQNDDRRIPGLDAFIGQEVVATLKMDGESATMYRDYYHARSLDSRHHSSRDWMKAFHAAIAHEIPPDWRLCGENLFAQHSIRYDNLESYFYLFNIWERGRRLSWDEIVAYASMLGISVVPVLYRGQWSEAAMHRIESELDEAKDEGYVVTVTRSFRAAEWRTCAAKYVRPSHIRTTQHWMTSQIIPNSLRVAK